MKRIGSITKFFPFLDEDTKSRIESILDLSDSYPEFVTRFCESTLEHESCDNAVIVAATLARAVRQFHFNQKLAKKYADVLIARPFFALPEGWTEAKRVEIAEDVLETDPEDWIKLRLLSIISATKHHSQNPLDAQAAREILRKQIQLVENNEELEHFRLDLMSIMYRHEEVKGDHEAGTKLCKEGLELARILDDPIAAAEFHLFLTGNLRNFDISKALEHAKELKNLIDELGLDYFKEEWLRGLGRIHNTRGEFSASIEKNLEAVKERQLTDSFFSLRYIPVVLAIVNIEIRAYSDALEWATLALEDGKFISALGSREASANLCMAMALAGLGRIGEAEKYLELAQKVHLEMGSFFGSSTYEGMIPYATALIELARGNIQYGYDYFEEAYHLYEKITQRNRMNCALARLAECEVALARAPYKWLTQLEEISREKDYPGFLGQALILKAEVQLRSSQDEEAARAALNEAVEISQQPGTRYLQSRIANLMQIVYPEE